MSQKLPDRFPARNTAIEKLRIHAIESGVLYATKDRTLFRMAKPDGELEALKRFRFNLQNILSGSVEICRRLFRSGFHHVICFRDMLLIFYDKDILSISAEDGAVVGATVAFIGSRPLAVCNASNEKLYYGEYSGSNRINSSGIFLSEDGLYWKEIYRICNIRHVHGIYFDPYGKAVWVTTGDADAESGIWVTKDQFKTLDRVIGGSQQARAVQLLFTETHVYFGSDTPLEKNFIYRLHKKTGRVEQLQEVESSVFWGCKVGDCLFFSTVVEPSRVNTSRHAYVWGSQNGEKWERIAGFRKDKWHMKLFQYGQIFFPAGENYSDYLFFTPFATEKHGTTQCLKVSEIFGD